MATISGHSDGRRGQKPLSVDIPLVPFPDLLTLTVRASGYELSSDAGERQWIEAGDRAGLRRALEARRQLDPTDRPVTVTSEDGVRYEALTAALDDANAAGYTRLEVSAVGP